MTGFPEWAAEHADPSPCPDGFYHWEQATMRLVRVCVHPRFWPSPWRRDSATGELREVNDRTRGRIVGECWELLCEEHVYFRISDIDRVLNSADKTPRWAELGSNGYSLGNKPSPFRPQRWPNDELLASMLSGKDAASLLLYSLIVPSSWPDVYWEESEQKYTRVSDRSEWTRYLFIGRQNSLDAHFMLEHAVQALVLDAQEKRAKAAYDIMAQFNYTQSTTALRYQAERERQLLEMAQQAAAPPRSQPQPETVAVAERDPSAPTVATTESVTTIGPRWHQDADAILRRHGDRVSADRVWSELSAMDDYLGGTEVLRTPDGSEITFKTLKNKLSDLRRKRR